ncbi:desmoplakin-A-like [Dendropsophus ebraccatus]|uniref:desmoplakin-A-like n=1 Tax=Dendropsophus ebraccatus TaxID=150705 RepID=UPI0038312F89
MRRGREPEVTGRIPEDAVRRKKEAPRPAPKRPVEENRKRREINGRSSTMTRLMNAERFLILYRSLLYEEETLGTDLETIEEKICKLKITTKGLKKVQIIIDSLKSQFFHNFDSRMDESKRVQDLIEKFDHTQTYMELRSYTLNKAQKQLMTFTKKGITLKTWLSEAQEFQEKLHTITCSSYHDIQRHLSLLQAVKTDCELIPKMLVDYEHSAQRLIATLQMMSTCSGIFYKALEPRTKSQSGVRKWHDILTVSVAEEATQVAERFSTLAKLNECYQIHLDGLLQQL